ncbi:DUF418 domain-containing protein [Variovorax sp. MHTC-1]|uniref:DUF418 domain-containing protein n=1 Tax=Variovorax sp. MHTC-1 TaxID=2495593 RepID=UPI000F87027B|nr:DUF418 domain-containing protein [Variovorax sp. MHTC-1]RST55511.1 DUF418 domain-containing protein [Variovorax sp. MHTC-1]
MNDASPHGARALQPPRLLHLDALRGFALLGILMVNITAFASAYFGIAAPDPAFARPVDRAVRWLVAFLFETKFYLLFSFLFGYSFTLQMTAAERSGKAFEPRMLRRLLGLWLIGAAHAVWLFHGDILGTYAVLGLVLLWLRQQTDAQAAWRACVLTLMPAAVMAVLGGLRIHAGEAVDFAGAAARASAAQMAWLGTPATVVAQRLQELGQTWWIVVLIQGPCALAMFMLGFLAGKRDMFARLDRYRGLWRRLAGWGLAVGLPGALVYATATVYRIGSGWEIVGLAVSLLSAPFLSAAYVGFAMMLFERARGMRIARLLAPAGRMALSNYLMQSLVCALIFTAYGLGWMGRVSPAACVLIASIIFATQLAASRLWLRHFSYGPVEWALRALTVGAWPAMRRAAELPPP